MKGLSDKYKEKRTRKPSENFALQHVQRASYTQKKTGYQTKIN